MGEAIIKGLMSSGNIAKENLHCFDINRESLTRLSKEYGIVTWESEELLAKACDAIIIAVKPGQVKQVLSRISDILRDNSVIISIAAGISIEFIQANLSGFENVIRVMPNTPCLVGEGAFVLACARSVSAEDEEFTKTVFHSLGTVLILDESLMDAVTGLSGSGPAFVFLAIDAMASGGVKMGLGRKDALNLAAQTVFGAAKMVLDTGLHPEELRDRVSSPGGTTIAGIHSLEKSGFRSALMDAVETASLRSKELGRRLG